MDHLTKAIREAEHIFVAHTEQLRSLMDRPEVVCMRRINEDSVREWLAAIKHDPYGRDRTVRRLASAYYRRQMIRYNPLYLKRAENDYTSMLDTVLHEMGHLFTYHFFHDVGHNDLWRTVGRIVGFADVGTAPQSRRERYGSYAAHVGKVEVEEPMLGQIGGVVEAINRSSIQSPVRVVWQVCRQHPYWDRRDIINECIGLGVNRNTAATQYAAWKREEGWMYR